MNANDYLQIRLLSNSTQADRISDLLEALGALAVTYTDAEDSPILEPMPGQMKLWPKVVVTGLFEKGTEAEPILNALQGVLGDNVPMSSEDLPDRDWIRAWMESFKPIKCADNLWITPSWCEAPDPKAVNVLLDPGLAFGTGTHPTTFLCLQKLASLDLKGQTLIDYGCGSGILAVAALKLGAKRAYGVDIDPQALIASLQNARRNEVSGRLVLASVPYAFPVCPLVVANILAGPLAQLEGNMAALCRKGGTLLLSGILEEQAPQVIEAYEKDFAFLGQKVLDEWVLMTFTRK